MRFSTLSTFLVPFLALTAAVPVDEVPISVDFYLGPIRAAAPTAVPAPVITQAAQLQGDDKVLKARQLTPTRVNYNTPYVNGNMRCAWAGVSGVSTGNVGGSNRTIACTHMLIMRPDLQLYDAKGQFCWNYRNTVVPYWNELIVTYYYSAYKVQVGYRNWKGANWVILNSECNTWVDEAISQCGTGGGWRQVSSGEVGVVPAWY